MAAHHQVPSTTHLDSLLVCKAKGMRLRQIVLLQPCALLHQNHPAPVAAMRYTLPGWHLSHDLCTQKAKEASEFHQRTHASEGVDACVARGGTDACGGGVGSFDPAWGFPDEEFEEEDVAGAREEDWQWFSMDLALETHALKNLGTDAHESSHLTRVLQGNS